MKTRNNTQKTVLNSLALTASILLISLTVSAQDLWQSVNENETTNEIALAINDKRVGSKPVEYTYAMSSVIYSETESESKMEVEEWMTNEKIFHVQEKPEQRNEVSKSKIIFVEVEDPELEFEDWMFNTKYWEGRN